MSSASAKLIVALDPGSEQTAYVVWDGTLKYFGIESNKDILGRLEYYAYQSSGYERLIIEMIGHYGKGMPAGKDVFDTCVWIGRFMQAFGADRTETVLRATIKAHVCGSAKAKDANVRQALIDRFGGPASIRKGGALYGVSKHTWAALAVAVTWWDAQMQGRAA